MEDSLITKFTNESHKREEDKYKPDNPTPKPKYDYSIVAQITHFFDKKPNTLQVEQKEPYLDGNFPKNGIVKIRLKKEESNVAFNLNTAEAFELAAILNQVARENIQITKSLWRRNETTK